MKIKGRKTENLKKTEVLPATDNTSTTLVSGLHLVFRDPTTSHIIPGSTEHSEQLWADPMYELCLLQQVWI